VARKSNKTTHTAASAAKLRSPVATRAEPSWEKFVPLLIAFIGLLAYLNSLHAPFIFDDRYHIVENTRIRQLWPLWAIVAHSSRPVVHLSLALNYALGGLNPLGYHLFNIGVHILAALVLWGIVRRTLRSESLKAKWGAAAAWMAPLVALLWLAHPIQTESVTYTVQRGESLMGLFYLLTLYCVIRSIGAPRGLWWQIAAVASCLLGVASKGVIVTAPLIVLLYDRAFLAKSWGELFRRRYALYAALAATLALFPVLLANAPEEWKDTAGLGYAGVSPLQYAMTQPGVILHYLRLAVWPAGLCLDYGWPVAHGAAEILLPLIAIGALLAATVWLWMRNPGAGFIGAWFFLILMPTSSFNPIADVVVEHRMYLSLAAVAMAAVIALAMLLKGSNRWAYAVGGLLVVVLIAGTYQRNLDYGSESAMWEDTVAKSPDNPRAHYDLGTALERDGRVPEAILHYQLAIQKNPHYADALTNLGHLLASSGKAAEAVPYLERAVQEKPGLAQAQNNLAFALVQVGRTQDAISHWDLALKIKPDYAEVYSNLGIVLAQQGNVQEAIGQWEQALRFDPTLADAHNNLAYALSQQGRTPDAISHYDEAVRLKPDSAQYSINLARLLATTPAARGGDPNRAIGLARHACDVQGNREAGCLDVLALAYAAANRFEDAVQQATNAVALARAAGQADFAREVEGRLALYRSGRMGAL
jgi:protein O-mannosyl-transferase